jgi:hypothetical protein
MECDMRTGLLFPRHLCSIAKETRPTVSLATEVGGAMAPEAGEREATAALALLMAMAMGFVDDMIKGTRQMGHATLCFEFAENICRRQRVQYLRRNQQ